MGYEWSSSGREAEALPLSAALSVILPTASETALLRACLLTGPAGRRAWDVWQQETSGIHGVTALSGSVKGLIPLIHRAAARNGAAVEGTARKALRAGYLREELRTTTYRRICAEVLSALQTEDIPVVVLRGAALADSVYEHAMLRHCHDLDLLLRKGDLARAARLLIARGLRHSREPATGTTTDVTLLHTSALPVELHSRLLAIPWYPVPLTEIWARARGHVVGDVPAHILSPADNLLHVCAHASYSPRRESLRWVCDSWFIIHRHPDLDWDVLVDCALRSHLALPLSVMLTYLARDIGLPVPGTVLARIDAAAARTDRIRREVALHGARAGVRGSLRTLVRTSRGWRARSTVIQWILLPSPAYVRWMEPVRGRWELPLRYVQRPLRYVLRRLRRPRRQVPAAQKVRA
jgi:hypothetical protein